ncbi:MAG: motility associated factor glycosyltransferase family protein [Planctomycetota bacterium]
MTERFVKNLDALKKAQPHAAAAIDAATPLTDITFSESKTPGVLTAVRESLGPQGQNRQTTLASKYRPLEEADRIASSADFQSHAVFPVLGFGLGYHVWRLHELTGGEALVVCYEPDAAQLRAVLERVDYADLFASPGFVLLVGEIDSGMITALLERHTARVTQGVQFITHPPTRQLSAEALARFSKQFAAFVAYCRTTLATTLVNAAVTCRNLTLNLGHYAAGATVNELAGAAAGRPAVLVSAGPSLARNVDLLTRPGVRDRVVIVAVQTVLKPLLDRGIRPHFVTALDYHEISTRFYEGVGELPDVTLVAEMKTHQAVLDAFPGPVRVLQNDYLDRLVGPGKRRIARLKAGSTVAHLSLYLAQHLGCDPIAMIGQDLGFSDGLYYCPGTAIHNVWAPELSAFNTLETMEWKRIARHKNHLQKRQDVRGQPIYSDEQMLTYHAQFERDFDEAPQRIIDATEGGLPKQGAEPMPLETFLERFATEPLPLLPAAARGLDPARLEHAAGLLDGWAKGVTEFATISRDTSSLMEKMLRDQREPAKMEEHFHKLENNQKRVAEMGAVFGLINELNQIGAFKRLRADRAIRLDDRASPLEKQAAQIERDLENLSWLIESSDEALGIFDEARRRVNRQIRQARQTVGGAA